MPYAYAIVYTGKNEVVFYDEQNPEELQLSGVSSCSFGWANQANYRLRLLSNHLQTRWQTTPAITAIKNEVIYSMTIPLPATSIGAVTF